MTAPARQPPGMAALWFCAAGADAADAIATLHAAGAATVVTVSLDVSGGEGRELEGVRDRALAAGAARAHVLDVRDQLARDFLVPALQAGAFAREPSALVRVLSAALAARKLAEMAVIEHARRIALPQDAEATLAPMIRALDATLDIVTLPGPAAATGPSRPVAGRRESAAQPAVAAVTFERGLPASLNGVAMPILDLLASLGALAGTSGMASAIAALQLAHTACRQAVSEPPLNAFADGVAVEYRSLIAEGRWFSDLRGVLDAAVQHMQPRIDGAIRLRLHDGAWTVAHHANSPA